MSAPPPEETDDCCAAEVEIWRRDAVEWTAKHGHVPESFLHEAGLSTVDAHQVTALVAALCCSTAVLATHDAACVSSVTQSLYSNVGGRGDKASDFNVPSFEVQDGDDEETARAKRATQPVASMFRALHDVFREEAVMQDLCSELESEIRALTAGELVLEPTAARSQDAECLACEACARQVDHLLTWLRDLVLLRPDVEVRTAECIQVGGVAGLGARQDRRDAGIAVGLVTPTDLLMFCVQAVLPSVGPAALSGATLFPYGAAPLPTPAWWTVASLDGPGIKQSRADLCASGQISRYAGLLHRRRYDDLPKLCWRYMFTRSFTTKPGSDPDGGAAASEGLAAPCLAECGHDSTKGKGRGVFCGARPTFWSFADEQDPPEGTSIGVVPPTTEASVPRMPRTRWGGGPVAKTVLVCVCV
jgi:hypothetical protein